MVRGLGHGLYQVLRGGGAVIEGVEFLLTHRGIARRHFVHFLASAACGLLALWVLSRLAGAVPAAPVIALPWYLVLLEWAWASVPALVAAEGAAWTAEILYLSLVPSRSLVAAVLAQRGAALPPTRRGRERVAVVLYLGVGAAGCGALMLVPQAGVALAALLACPVLGTGFVVAVLTLRGWEPHSVSRYVRSHGTTLTGLGLALVVTMAIPAVNLVALLSAAVGATCLLAREPAPAGVKTSAETSPCASQDR